MITNPNGTANQLEFDFAFVRALGDGFATARGFACAEAPAVPTRRFNGRLVRRRLLTDLDLSATRLIAVLPCF